MKVLIRDFYRVREFILAGPIKRNREFIRRILAGPIKRNREFIRRILAGPIKRNREFIRGILAGPVKGTANLFAGSWLRVLAIRRFRKLNEKQYARIFSQLKMFLSSGLPLLKALELINNELFNKAIEELRQGKPFSQALYSGDQKTPIVIINMIKVAEHNGSLDAACGKLSNYFSQRSKYKEKIKAALIYPSFILSISFLLLMGLFIFVLPTFNALFADLGVELPGATRAIIYVSGKLPLVLFLFLLLWSGAFFMLRKTEKGLLLLDRLKLRFIFVRTMLLASSAQTLGSLLASGVAILPALDIVVQNINNRVFQRAFSMIKESVENGISLADSMKSSKLFPDQMVQMVSVGEGSGNLDQILIQTADHYESEVFYSLKKLVSMLEPLSTVVVGVFVGFIALSVIFPLINLINTLQ